MNVVRSILVLVMGLMYYALLAIPLTIYDLIWMLGADLKSIIFIWTWPILFAQDPLGFIAEVDKACKKDESQV